MSCTPKPKIIQMPPPEDPDWKRDLICHPNSYTPKANTANALHAFTHAPEWRNVLWFDEFRYRIMVDQPPPWDGAKGNRPLTDEDAVEAAVWLQHQGIEVRTRAAEEGLAIAARKNQRHPLRDMLNAFEWDGIARVNTWLTDYMGVEDSTLIRHIGRCWLVSAIARAFEPGCQADHCIVFEGKEGLLKSSAIRALAGEEFFAVHVAQSLANRDAAIQCAGVWIVEFSELQSLKGRTEEVKSFLSIACRPNTGL